MKAEPGASAQRKGDGSRGQGQERGLRGCGGTPFLALLQAHTPTLCPSSPLGSRHTARISKETLDMFAFLFFFN